MTTILASIVIVLLAIGGLAVGVMAGRRPIAGSCGGLGQCGLKLECASCPNHPREGEG